jgi:hypothetical protein
MYKFTTRNFLNNNQDQIILPAGNYKGITLYWEYTNDADSVLSLANLGILRLYSPAGGKMWDFTLQRLAGFNEFKTRDGRQSLDAVGNSTAGIYSIYIPFHFNDDSNIARLSTGYVLEYQHDSLSAIVSAATLTVLLQRGLGVQRYFPIFQDYNIRTLSSETTPEDFPRKNLAYITITPDTDITVVKLEKDNNLVYDLTDEQIDVVCNQEKYGDNAYTTFTTATSPWVLDLYKERNLTEILGTNYKYGVVDATDTTVAGMTVEFQMNEAALDTTSQVMASVKEKNATTPAEKIVA